MSLVDLLKEQEGYRRNPYLCTQGYNTVGYGRNLDTAGIDEEEAEYLLKRDIERCRKELARNLDMFDSLSNVRQDALINMAFQLGVSGMLKFKTMLFHLSRGEYEDAAMEALNSRWYRQTPNRAIKVAKMIETGRY